MKAVITEINWPEGITLLEQSGFEVLYDSELWKDRKRLEKEIENSDALIVRNQTNVDNDLLCKGRHLSVLGRLGVGLDNIDLEAAKNNNIEVITAKNANAASVAEYVISALFHIARPLLAPSRDVQAGNWDRKRFTMDELYGKTLGLIGIGETALRAAARAKELGLHLIGYDPFVKQYDYAVMETGIEMMKLSQVLQQSNFVSLHVPLTIDTKYLINKDRMQQMKPDSWIINSSRGGVVKEDDLYYAIKENYLGGAVLDVLEKEPVDQQHPLLELDNCLITPHIAGLTEEAQSRTSIYISEEIIKRLKM